MKKRRKDKSTKVAITSAVVVTVLVGATVFSLYSLSEPKEEGLYLSVFAAEEDNTSSGKLLTRMTEDDASTVSTDALWLAEPADDVAPIDSAVKTDNKESEAEAAELPVSDPAPALKTVEEIVGSFEEIQEYSASEGINLLMVDGAELSVAGTEQTVEETAETVSEITEEEISEAEEVYSPAEALTYVPGNEHPDAEESLTVPVSADVQSAGEDYSEGFGSVGDEPNEAYTEPDLTAAADETESIESYYAEIDYPAADDDYSYDNTYYDNSADSEYEWVYNYDTEEWDYVEVGQSYYNTDYGYSYDTEDTSDDSEYEWVYNYDTEEWDYVEVGQTNNNTDNDYSNDTDDDYSYDTEDTSDDSGYEWVYNYDTEEWEYVETGNTDYDDDDDDEDYDDEDYDDSDYEEESYTENYSPLGQQIVDYAMGYVGVTPYVWAGRSLYSGTDCSGFVNLIYSEFGIYCSTASLSYDGSSFGYIVSASEARAGDIAVYGGGDHVAIYAGNGYVVHCSSPENGTVYWNMNYRSDFSWFLRVID